MGAAAVLLTVGIALMGFGFTVAPQQYERLSLPMVLGGLFCSVLALESRLVVEIR